MYQVSDLLLLSPPSIYNASAKQQSVAVLYGFIDKLRSHFSRSWCEGVVQGGVLHMFGMSTTWEPTIQTATSYWTTVAGRYK